MNLRIIPSISVLLLSCMVASGAEKDAATSDAAVRPIPTEARRLALESAGAFTNEGFRIRDAEWAFTLSKGTQAFLQVTLFAGNHYWFVTASPTPASKLRVTLYDKLGKPLKTQQWQELGEHGGSRAAAGISTERSGSYFVGVEILDAPGDLPLDCSLVIAYK